MWTQYFCIIWEFKFANLCQGYHASLLTTTWGRIGKTKITTKTSDASSPHRLLTPSSCSQLNSGQTSRLVSCGVTFGSQYTHLIRPSSFFQRTPSARFSPSLLILALLDMSRFLWLLMMLPLSGFLIGLDVQHFVFMVLQIKGLGVHSILFLFTISSSPQVSGGSLRDWGSQTEHFLSLLNPRLMLVTVTTGKLSRVITPSSSPSFFAA